MSLVVRLADQVCEIRLASPGRQAGNVALERGARLLRGPLRAGHSACSGPRAQMVAP